MMSYVYIRTEPKLWTVGFYHDEWEPDSDHDSPEKAAARVRWLNGGDDETAVLRHQVAELQEALGELCDSLETNSDDPFMEFERVEAAYKQARTALGRVGGGGG